jgi:hypothetical protein
VAGARDSQIRRYTGPMARRKPTPPKEPRNASEAFDEYARASYREIDLRKELEDWQKAHPGGDPGGMLALWSDAVQVLDKAAKKLEEFTKR